MKRILVVDDETIIRDLVAETLQDSYDVVTAAGVADGIKKFQSGGHGGPFNLVITDMTMPGKSGLDLIREIHTVNKTVPIIVMSGEMQEYIQGLDNLEIPWARRLKKPFNIDHLVGLVGMLLSGDSGSFPDFVPLA